jgi:hypothetical protein
MNVQAEVTMLNPSASTLARWIVTACLDAGTTRLEVCAKRLLREIWSASNAQFPVSGYVIEPASVIGGPADQPRCFPFRNGVTVRTATGRSGSPVNGACGPVSYENEPLITALRFTRLASTTRAQYLAAGGLHPVGATNGLDALWSDAIRREYMAAWTSGRNILISARAKAMKAAGQVP